MVQEGGDEVYMVKMRMGGNPGLVHLHVRDRDGEAGASRLQSDVLDVILEANNLPFPPPPSHHPSPTTCRPCVYASRQQPDTTHV